MRRLLLLLAVSFWLLTTAKADDAKPALQKSELAAADQLYRSGKFADAAEQYQAVLKVDDTLVPAQSGLVHALLRQQKIDEASLQAGKALAAQPNSAALLAAMGDVQFRLAEMSEAENSYLKALNVDPKELHAYLGLARLHNAFSLRRRAYDELKAAYMLAPDNPDVQRLWFDRLVSKIEQTDTKLERMLRDPRHISGYGLTVKMNDRNSKLLLDTGASGILIGRKSAEKAGLQRISELRYYGIGDKGTQGGYLALADHIRIGELEFADCLVRVADRTSLADEDGLLGADVFSSYLIDIDFPDEKLRLSPLPKRPDDAIAPTALNTEGESRSNPDDKTEGPSDQKAESASDASKAANTAPPAPRLPRDRYVAPEMKGWAPVFRFGHELLIATLVNNSKPMLFLIDTGSGVNLLSTRAGREVTKISSDPNIHVKGLSGTVNDVYRADNATLQFGRFVQKNQNVVTVDLSKFSKHTGTEISGVLGFQLLRMLQVKIDYRDGLVDFVYDAKRWQSVH